MRNKLISALAALAAGVGFFAAPAAAAPAATSASLLAAHRLPPASGHVTRTSSLTGGPVWVWAGGHQTLTGGVTATGASSNLLVAEPYEDNTNDSHTLVEVAARDTATGNTIEIGWNVDPNLYSGSQVHLFSGAWKNGVFLGYNASVTGYVDYSGNATNVGANIHADSVDPTFTNRIKKFTISYDTTVACGSDLSGGWWISYANAWVGCYQNSIWGSGVFTHVDNAEYFGEVATFLANGKACSDMGNGKPGNSEVLPLDASDPAFFASTSWVLAPTPPTSVNTLYNDDSLGNTTNAAYDSFNIGSTGNRTFTFGGKGYTSTGTTPGNLGSC